MIKRLLLVSLLLCLPFFIPTTAYARTDTVGDLTITWDDPIFNVSNAYPGYAITKTIVVKNNGTSPYDLGVVTENEDDSENLATQIWVTIRKQGGSDVYGGGSGTGAKHLSNLFSEGEVALLSIAAGDTHVYEIELALDSGVGNDYQGKKTRFDFTLGFSGGVSEAGAVSGASVGGAVSTETGGKILGANILPITGGASLGLLGTSFVLFGVGLALKLKVRQMAPSIDKA